MNPINNDYWVVRFTISSFSIGGIRCSIPCTRGKNLSRGGATKGSTELFVFLEFGKGTSSWLAIAPVTSKAQPTSSKTEYIEVSRESKLVKSHQAMSALLRRAAVGIKTPRAPSNIASCALLMARPLVVGS